MIVAHKHLVVPHDPRIVGLFPAAKQITYQGNPHVVVPHDLAATAYLRRLGHQVPAPVLSQYAFPSPPDRPPYDVQKRTVALMTTERRCYVLNGLGCVDADTEYLSPTGWERIADYRDGKVAQYHPDTGEIEFVEPMAYVKKPCAEMIRFKTNYGVDQLLSPEHRVLLADGRVVSAEQVEQAYYTPNKRGGGGHGRLSRKSVKFRTTFKVRGTVGLPLTDAQIRVQVAVNADGYYKDCSVRVRLLKQRKIARMHLLLQAAGVTYASKVCKASGFTVFKFRPIWAKGFSSRWWGASQSQLETVADEATHWDGSFRKSDGWAFSSYSKADADFVQYAYSAAGRRAAMRVTTRTRRGRVEVDHIVTASAGSPETALYGTGAQGVKRNVWREPSPDGFKYCFMVPSTFLLLRRNGKIFATGNTGKTRCTLWSFDFLRKCGLANKLLVVAPLSTLWFVWEREVFEVFPHLKISVLFGTKEKRLKKLAEPADIYVINHDGLGTIRDELDKRTDINAIVIDELSVYRNGSSKRTKAMRKFVANKDWAWGLTGSPMPREVTDIWGQASIITPHTVPKYFGHLQQQLMYKAGPFKWVARDGAVEQAFAMLQPSVRFSLDDVLELPEQVMRYVEVPLGPKQAKIYKEMRAKAVAHIEEATIDAMNAGAALSKLLQIAMGWVYTRDGQTITLDNEARVEAIVDNVAAAERKVLVFMPFKSALAGVSEALTKEKIEHCVVSGDTPAGKRKELFSDFQTTGLYKAMVAHPGCLAHGLTLTAADTIIWGGPVTDLETFMQANGRITRIGQKHKQLVLMLGGTPAERKIYTALGNKENVQNYFLDLLAEASR